MIANVITLEDLESFRKSLMEDIEKLYSKKHVARKWLKSHEVRRVLAISPGTLQNLRVNGSLPFTKIGGVIYYEATDIDQMLLQNKRVDQRHPFSLEKRSMLHEAAYN